MAEAHFSPEPYPTPAEVAEICAIPNRIPRNLCITECYSRISQAMAARTGPCANWCTFATWASRQAGATIRGEDLEDRFARHAGVPATLRHPVGSIWRRLLRIGIFDPSSRLGRLVAAVHTPFDAFERASSAVAEGNLKVFEEIGLEFARYLNTARDRIPQFLESLQSDLLRSAFTCYEQALTEPVPSLQAQLILLANLQIGLHEQTRLQPQIQAALEVGPVTAEDLARRIGWLLAYPAARYRKFALEITRRVVTEALMVLKLPGAVLQLGRHLDAPVPDALRDLTAPALAPLLTRFEPRGPHCTNCGADDWADLSQRMHYILHLFRAWHLQPALLEPPFTPGQLRDIRAARIPEGDL